MLGALKGRKGSLASRAAEGERARARNAGSAIAGSLERDAAARDTIEVPGLSKAAPDTLNGVQFALHATAPSRDGERHDARLSEALASTADRVDLAAGVLVFESLNVGAEEKDIARQM